MVRNPQSPLIAVVGSLDERRADLRLRQPDSRCAPAEAVGRELAKVRARMVAYSSEPAFVDPHVVRGFVASGLAQPGSIVV
jgi:hypothetical protein